MERHSLGTAPQEPAKQSTIFVSSILAAYMLAPSPTCKSSAWAHINKESLKQLLYAQYATENWSTLTI